MRPTKRTYLILNILGFIVIGFIWFYAFDVQWGPTWQAVSLGLPLLLAMAWLVWRTVIMYRKDSLRAGSRAFVVGVGVFVYSVVLIVFFSATLVGAPRHAPPPQDTPENHLLQLVLEKQYGHGFGYAVVNPFTSIGWAGGVDEVQQRARLHDNLATIYQDQVGPVTPEADASLAVLLDDYFKLNVSPIVFSLPSDPGGGAYIDYGYKFDRYFARGGGGWFRWRLFRPGARESVVLSMPAYDPASGLVLVYIGRSYASPGGVGDLVCYRLADDRLTELGRIRLWSS